MHSPAVVVKFSSPEAAVVERTEGGRVGQRGHVVTVDC